MKFSSRYETLGVWKSLLTIGILQVKETYALGLATSPSVPLKRRPALIEKTSARRWICEGGWRKVEFCI